MQSTPTAPRALSVDPALPLKYVGGHPAVDLVNTVDWTTGGLDHDRLSDYNRLTRWAEGAGVVSAEEGARLRRLGDRDPGAAATALEAAQRARWVLGRLFGAVAAGGTTAQPLGDFNTLLADVLPRLQLAERERGGSHRRDVGAVAAESFRWAWRGASDRLDSLLWPVLWSAASLLTSAEAGRLRVCAAPDCGWMYVDRSRNGLRRWCQMGVCGTREKSRRRQLRARPAGRAAARR
jgi:predicted RNA-binding Zn ribbon-like protein